VSREAVNEGLERMDLEAQAELSLDDWLMLTDNGVLCTAKGELDPAGWQRVCFRQLSAFALSVMQDTYAAAMESEGSETAAWMPVLKLLLLDSMNGPHEHAQASSRPNGNQ